MEPATAVGSSATDPREEHFHPSRRNPLRPLRVTLWASCTVGLVIGALAARGQPTHLLVLAGALLLFLLPADWLIRRQIRDGRRLITITRDAIASAAFSGKEKRLLWSEIESVTVETVQSAPYLAFRLKAGSGTAGRRRFLAWRNRSKRILALSSFDTADRERLLDSIQIHLRLHGGSVGAQSMPVNPFKAERQFEEKLEALAPQPRFTYALIVLNVLAWLVTLMLGGNPLQTPISVLFNLGGNAAFEVQHGEWWRLLSATFLHAGVLHLAINMAGLYATGIAVERIYGPAAYLLIYLGAGLLGSALSLSFAAQHAIGVGASGAVFGVAGAWLVAIGRYRGLMPQTLSKRLLTQLGLFVLYSLGQGLTKPGVDNAAHIGGLVGGCMLAMILPARLDMDRYRQLLPGRAAMALAAAGAHWRPRVRASRCSPCWRRKPCSTIASSSPAPKRPNVASMHSARPRTPCRQTSRPLPPGGCPPASGSSAATPSMHLRCGGPRTCSGRSSLRRAIPARPCSTTSRAMRT